MSCVTLYDVKKIAYNTKDYADYLTDIGTTFQEILIHKEGITIDTKSEVAEYTALNGTRYVDSERVSLREIGTLKFTKNFDSALLTNHSELVKAGLGNILGGVGTSVVVTAGKGSSGTPFLTTSTTGLSAGNIVYFAGIGFRVVTSVVPNTSFTVDVPLATAISTSTTFVVKKSVDITNAIGNCDKTFNFVISLQDGTYIKMRGCGVTCEFNPSYERQLMITFNITSPSVSNVEVAPTGFSTATAETKGTPVKCSFSECLIGDDDGYMYPYIPPKFELGLSVTSDPIDAIGGLNNKMGYLSRCSVKSKIVFDRIAKCKTWVTSPRLGRVYSFYQSNFGIYIAQGKMTLIDTSVANGNRDSIAIELDTNYDKDYKVYLVLP